MRRLYLVACLLVTLSITNAQRVQFTCEGDSTTIPLVRDSLRGISGLEIVPSTSEWHLVSDRGRHFTFANIRIIRDSGDSSHLKTAQKTPC